MKRFCELCKRLARMHCESDQASLCWDCDGKVHSANFLVARHSRNILCQICQTPTQWSAAGPVLAPTVSVCERCVECGRRCDDESENEIDNAVEEIEENQIVPWSPPPETEISSGSEGSVDAIQSRKRCRIQIASSNPSSNDDHGRSSSDPKIKTQPLRSDSSLDAAGSVSSECQKPPPEKIRRSDLGRVGTTGSEILESLRRLHAEETNPGAEIAVDLNYYDSS